MNKKLFFKIASDIYTYLKEADQQQNNQLITFQQLKSDILGKRDEVVSNKIKAMQSTSNYNDFISLINKTDAKGYTLLMLAASNNLEKTVKQLIICGADTTKTITIKGDLFKKLLNYKIKNETLTQQEIEQLKNEKQYEATALDIAKIKNLNNIINILL